MYMEAANSNDVNTQKPHHTACDKQWTCNVTTVEKTSSSSVTDTDKLM